MEIIGRIREQEQLAACLESPRPEFVAVHGRRRVGKTYLIREFFKNRFAFYASGVDGKKTREQLKAFNDSLREYGCEQRAIPKDWFEAFSRLRHALISARRLTISGTRGARRRPIFCSSYAGRPPHG